MAQITKDTIIGDILDIAPETAPILLPQQPGRDGGGGLRGPRRGREPAAGGAEQAGRQVGKTLLRQLNYPWICAGFVLPE